jgi:dihydropteroate synthase
VAVLANLALYHALGVPVLLGASRKKLIDHISDAPKPEDRVPGSIAAALAAAAQGVQIVRVHDVAATRQALSVWQAAMFATDRVPA